MGPKGWIAGVPVVAALALTGCGSSSGSPSQLNPAQIAPAKSVAYVELTVRPQGSARSDAESGLTKLLGYSPDASVQRLVGRLFKHAGLNYASDLQPWLGERIGLVLTEFSKSGLGLIAPTNNPSAALAALKRAEKNAGLTSANYHGVLYQQGSDNGTPVSLGIVGHYAVIASPPTFDDIVDASQGSSLLSRPAFASAFGGLPSSALARAYVSGPAAISALMFIPTLSNAIRRQLRAAVANGKVPAALTLSVSASSKSIAVELRSTATSAIHLHSSADVSHLPGQSWLALSTGSGLSKAFSSSFRSGFIQGFNRSALARGVNPGTLLNLLQRRIGINLERDLLPALGGFQLALQGNTPLTFGAGLAVHPNDPQAAARLLVGIRNLVARSHSLTVNGGPRSFTISKPGLPIPRIVVADVGREVLATLDEPNFQGLLAPATTLATNPAFQKARSQLVAGSNVPLFVDFGPLAALLGQTPQFTGQGRDAKALKVLRRLDYLVLGFNQASEDVQLVLGLR
jgi:hypothetical protein